MSWLCPRQQHIHSLRGFFVPHRAGNVIVFTCLTVGDPEEVSQWLARELQFTTLTLNWYALVTAIIFSSVVISPGLDMALLCRVKSLHLGERRWRSLAWFEAVFVTRAVVSCVVKRGAMGDRQSAFLSTIFSQSVGPRALGRRISTLLFFWAFWVLLAL